LCEEGILLLNNSLLSLKCFNLKKIDKQIHSPEEIEKFIQQYKEQTEATIKREELENERRRRVRDHDGRIDRFDSAERIGDIKEFIKANRQVSAYIPKVDL
jgi:hypothetical protein